MVRRRAHWSNGWITGSFDCDYQEYQARIGRCEMKKMEQYSIISWLLVKKDCIFVEQLWVSFNSFGSVVHWLIIKRERKILNELWINFSLINQSRLIIIFRYCLAKQKIQNSMTPYLIHLIATSHIISYFACENLHLQIT